MYTTNISYPQSGSGLFRGTSVKTDYVWENLIIGEKVSFTWIQKIAKHTPLYHFWRVLSSPV